MVKLFFNGSWRTIELRDYYVTSSYFLPRMRRKELKFSIVLISEIVVLYVLFVKMKYII